MAQANGSTHIYYVPKPSAVISANGAGNGETIKTNGYAVSAYDPGANRTGVILEAGVEDGQAVTVVNTANAAESITFATGATSNVAGGTGVVIAQNSSMLFTWNAATARWYSYFA